MMASFAIKLVLNTEDLMHIAYQQNRKSLILNVKLSILSFLFDNIHNSIDHPFIESSKTARSVTKIYPWLAQGDIGLKQ